MAEGDELPRRGGGVPGAYPQSFFLNEYVLRCNLVHFETQF